VRPWPSAVPDPSDDFLSGINGQVYGIRATSRAVVVDAVADARAAGRLQTWRLRRAARAGPRLRVLALAVERENEPNLLAPMRTELLRSRHDVRFHRSGVGSRGKFQNLNRLLESNPPHGFDWLLILDDDVTLPRGFLDSFLFLAQRFGLRMAQPAHRALSHAAWPVTRRRSGGLIRETAYVEIGPIVALHASTFSTLLPFPDLRAGWGLDAHWAAIAQQHNWPIGIVDATPIRHRMRRIAVSYDRTDAIAEGRAFLAGRPYLRASETQRTLADHRNWR
jgi:predicted nucleic acid-binding protein